MLVNFTQSRSEAADSNFLLVPVFEDPHMAHGSWVEWVLYVVGVVVAGKEAQAQAQDET